jgi:hypothetical protein
MNALFRLLTFLSMIMITGCRCHTPSAPTDTGAPQDATAEVATDDAPTASDAPTVSDASKGGLPAAPRLTIKNSCGYDLWIAQQNIPGLAASTQLKAGTSMDAVIPAEGLASSRVWAMKCDAQGQNCSIGQSSPPCPATQWGCSPPVDSKLEATWGCTLADKTKCGKTPQGVTMGDTFWNGSAVDGYTFPFAIAVTGGDGRASCAAVDCSALTFKDCPLDDNLSNKGANPQYAHQNLHVFNQKSVQVGCYSPCMKLNYPTPWADGLNNPSGSAESMYCCPTPPVSPQTCSAGPVATTKYVETIHNACKKTTYGYPYDDGIGLRQCSGDVVLSLTFGPNCP